MPVALKEWLGYAWVCLADTPPPFEDVVADDHQAHWATPTPIDHYGIDEPRRRPAHRLRRGGQLEADRRELHGVLPLRDDPPRARRACCPSSPVAWPRSANVGHGAEFGSEIDGFTVDGSAPASTRLPGITDEQDRRYYAITVKPTVFINLVPDHIIFHRMYPMAADRTVVECDWLYTADVVDSGPRRLPLRRAVPPGQRAGLRGLRAHPAGHVVARLSQRWRTRTFRTPHRGVPRVGSVPNRRRVIARRSRSGDGST